MDYEVESVRSRCRPQQTWSEVTENDCQTRQICKEFLWTVGNAQS